MGNESIKKEYKVEPIPTEHTKDWILNKHYAKRMPSITYAFGLYLDKKLCGVCTFGFPMASQLQDACNGLAKIVELNRLVVNEGLGKNVLSFFVSKCLLLLPKPLCVVSYADEGQGHHGYIYQATNWIYTGTGSGGWGWAVKGFEFMHHTSIEDSVGRYENRAKDESLEILLRRKYGDKLYKKEESPKHRYFFFCVDKKDKQKFQANLKYKTKPYPKGENKRYDASYQATTMSSLF
jgi:hypothetical protein